ncbi:transcriptional regulator family: Fungal Specific TF [Paecilomyces variotii]|nr:transcriptional regulator family: Fungal Specific TF [Paecilomyces variotii]
MTDPSQYRPIAPGPTPDGSPPGDSRGISPAPWKKRVSTACLACKRSKRKCSGVPPCDNCRALNRECIFDESLDQRRRVAVKRTAEELNYHRDMLNDLFKVIRSANHSSAQQLLDIIRNDATPEEIRIYIDETLAKLQGGENDTATKDTTNKLKDIRRMVNLQGPSPSFRRKVMDVHFLCDTPPMRVPAKPWTTVTDDDEIVSHLVSLYFTWDYPFYAFLDSEVFVKHMAIGDIHSEFCTPFLVNALLANACHYSEFSEAYAVPGDVMTKGADYLREAERLYEEQKDKATLATLQGTLLLYSKYSLFGDDDLGYLMLNRAVGIAKDLGYISDEDDGTVSLEGRSQDYINSTVRTVWGLYQIDTVSHIGFLRPNRISHVRLERPRRLTQSEDNAVWIPYPTHRSTRGAYYNLYFDEACSLSQIAQDLSRSLFSDTENPAPVPGRQEIANRLYERLTKWKSELPDVFNPEKNPAPHMLLLNARYYTTLINLFMCLDSRECSAKCSTGSSPPTPPGSPEGRPEEIKLHCAREIASLMRIHRREFSMSRSHAFALYAINMALYVLLDQPAGKFDILDQDFLSLASAFNIIASRSILGRNMFHIFRQSVRSKEQGAKARSSDAVPEELKQLFSENLDSDKWDDYASGLEKLNEDSRYPSIGADHGEVDPRKLQHYEGFGLCDMLERYESLSLGRDDTRNAKSRGVSGVDGL